MSPLEPQNTVIPPVTNPVTATVTEQKAKELAQQPAKRLFFVLFSDSGTETDKIISADAYSFFRFVEDQLKTLESAEVELNKSGDEQVETKLEDSGVRALAIFEVPDNIDLTELQKQSVSSHLLPDILKDAEPAEKSLTASQE